MQETSANDHEEPESPVVLRRPKQSSSDDTDSEVEKQGDSDVMEEKLPLKDNKISMFNVEQSVSTETEPRQSRPSSSDFSEGLDKLTERRQGDKENTSRPSSSDYSDILEKKEMTAKAMVRQASSSDYSDQQDSKKELADIAAAAPADSSETEPEIESKPGRPVSSDYSDIFDPINKPEERDNVDDEPMESIKDRISKFNSGSVSSLDREGRQRYPSGSVSSLDKESRIFTSETFGRTIQIEERTEDTSVESVKDRVSKFNSGSVTSLDRESDTKPAPRPPSSDYSDLLERKVVFEGKEADSASARADQETLAELPVSSISDKINKFTLQSGQSSETEPEDESRRSSRPVSSDYSDIFDGKKEPARETQEDEPMESIKERISKFNSGSVTSLDRESANKFPSRPTSGYSDFGEKKAMFEAPIEERSSSKLSLAASVTSSETESDMKLPRQSSSEYSDNEEKKDLETKAESVSEMTEEHTDTVKEKSGATEDPEDSEAIQKSSSDSSMSDKKSDQELTRQDAFDKASALRRKQSSSEYSESDVEGRKVESSSDYDSASNRGRKRPDSMISDTSSDYDSLSNVGSRRPQSFVIDDEYDVITEEGESEKQNKEEDTASSSSESEGPDPKEAGQKTRRIPPPGTLKESSGEDDDQDGEDQSTSFPSQIPQPSHSSLASSSSVHVEQSSVSVNVVKSSINNLEESSYMVEEITSTTNIETKNMAEIAGNFAEDLAQSTSHSATKQSSSSASSFDLQAQKDGSSESGKSQGITIIT